MINFNAAKNAVIFGFNRGGLILSKISPELLTGVGVVGVVASIVMASEAGRKVDGVLDEYREEFEKIHEVKKIVDTAADPERSGYSDEDYQKDLAITYVQRIVAIGKLYLPTIVVGGISIACILGGHKILSKRNAAIMAAYKALDTAYKAYRQRVSKELGEGKGRDLRYGIQHETIEEKVVNAAGKEEVTAKDIEDYDPRMESPYAVFFDEQSPQYKRDVSLNEFYLRSMQNYCNDILVTRGHVFLNEVYSWLGLPHTQTGAITGWLKNGTGDGYIDFGLNDAGCYDNWDREKCYPPNVWLLDFNVDGIIYDKI